MTITEENIVSKWEEFFPSRSSVIIENDPDLTESEGEDIFITINQIT